MAKIRLTPGWGLFAGILALLAVVGVVAHEYLPVRPTASNAARTSTQTQPPSSQNNSQTQEDNHSPDSAPAAPLYTPSQLVSSTQSSTTYSSESPSYTVINFYGEYLSTNGWKITSETTLNGTTTIHAENNGRVVSVAIDDAPNNGSTFTIQTL